MITDWNGESMTGLFTLVEENGKLSYPGNNLAEYQVWLSSSENNDKFIKEALDAIRKDYSLHLKYIPSKTPLEWLNSNGKLKNSIFLKAYSQPIMQCDEVFLEKELKKKNKKEKINRLKRQGKLSFERVTSSKEFRAILPNLIEQNEFRKGAIYGKLAFLEDPRRIDFLSKAFEHNLLHASILKLDEEIIASNVGFISNDTVHLQGLNTHSPFYSKFSPGILHFLMLGIYLSKENYNFFDLTPGGIDGYKSKLATSYSTTHEILMDSVFTTKKNQVKDALKTTAKTLIGNNTKKASQLSKLFTSPIKKNTTENNSEENANIQLIIKGNQINLTSNEPELEGETSSITYQKNSIADLLSFPLNNEKTEFLSDALYRIENGQTFYAIKGGDHLIGTIWYIPRGTKEPDGHKRSQDYMEFSYLTLHLRNNWNVVRLIIKEQELPESLSLFANLIPSKSSLDHQS